MMQALAFVGQIEATGRAARLLVEHGDIDDVTVVLTYDRAPVSGTAFAS